VREEDEMGFFGKLIDAAVNVALTPVDVVMDVATLGGAMTEEDEPYTVKRIKKVVEKTEEAGEDAGNGDWV